jgi:hypothetical protein
MALKGMKRSETPTEIIQRLSMPVPECGCYAWLGAHSRGYAKMQWFEGKTRMRARVARFLCEPIPNGLEVDHLCRMRWCVNPDHLELVTHQENIRRHWESYTPPKTCPKGHPIDKQWGRFRWCHACKMEYQREYRTGIRRNNHGYDQSQFRAADIFSAAETSTTDSASRQSERDK